MADIRVLNYLTFLTFQLCVFHSQSRVCDCVEMKDLNTFRTAALIVDKPALISQHLNTPLKLCTLTTHQ